MKLPDNCIVRLMDLPCKVGALVSVDEEGISNIYLNSRLSRESQRENLRHEIEHIENDDVNNNMNIREVESRRK